MGVGVARDDIVIIPSFTFIATANAVSHVGAAVWLMDIDPKSWTLNAEQLESELAHKSEFRDGILIHRQSGRRIAAIMPVYTLGNIPDMDKISLLAEKYHLPVIADAAVAWFWAMTNIQAAVGCAQFERLEEFLTRKRYIREFIGVSCLTLTI